MGNASSNPPLLPPVPPPTRPMPPPPHPTASHQPSPQQISEGEGDDHDHDDDDVVLERENSAWDVLEDRFQKASSDGRYLDLSTDDGSVRELGAADAEEALAVVEPLVDPSTIVPTAQELHRLSKREAENQQGPLLNELSTLVNELATELKSAREKFMNGSFQNKKEIRHINRLSLNVQNFVNRNADTVMDSSVAVRRIENMNLLIYKANALITTFNITTIAHSPPRSSSISSTGATNGTVSLSKSIPKTGSDRIQIEAPKKAAVGGGKIKGEAGKKRAAAKKAQNTIKTYRLGTRTSPRKKSSAYDRSMQ